MQRPGNCHDGLVRNFGRAGDGQIVDRFGKVIPDVNRLLKNNLTFGCIHRPKAESHRNIECLRARAVVKDVSSIVRRGQRVRTITQDEDARVVGLEGKSPGILAEADAPKRLERRSRIVRVRSVEGDQRIDVIVEKDRVGSGRLRNARGAGFAIAEIRHEGGTAPVGSVLEVSISRSHPGAYGAPVGGLT